MHIQTLGCLYLIKTFKNFKNFNFKVMWTH